MKWKDASRNTKACLENSLKDDLAGTWVSCGVVIWDKAKKLAQLNMGRARNDNSPSLLRAIVLAVFSAHNAFPPDLQMPRSCSLCRSLIKVIPSQKSTLTNLWKNSLPTQQLSIITTFHFLHSTNLFLCLFTTYLLKSHENKNLFHIVYCQLPTWYILGAQ